MIVDNWSEKSKRRRAEGTGRMRYKKTLASRFKNGFKSCEFYFFSFYFDVINVLESFSLFISII